MYRIPIAQETNRGDIQTVRTEPGKIPSTDGHEDKSDDSGIFDRRIKRRSVLKGAAAVAISTATLPVETALENIERRLLSTIEIDPKEIFQKILGFGGAMTDSSAYNIWISSRRDEIMRTLFDTNEGIGINLLRLPIGGSDFVVNNPMYSYDDLPPGETDVNLEHFSIDHDREYILPLLQQAVKLNPDIKFIATPWSPPGWMKSNHSLLGTIEKKVGTLLPEYYSIYAGYLVKFIQAYQAEGIAIDTLTPQNEPFSPVDTYPGMLLTTEEEARFIKDYLYPALKKPIYPLKSMYMTKTGTGLITRHIY